MPAKGSKRGRKGRAGSNPAASSQPAAVLSKPASHKPVDYSKFDNLDDSDDDDTEHGVFTPSELGFPEPDSTNADCECEHCQARAEAAKRTAASATRLQASSNRAPSQQQLTPGSPGFNFSKALGESAKVKIAEGKASRTHGLDENTHPFHASSGDHSWHSAMNGMEASSSHATANGHTKSEKQSSQVSKSKGNSDSAVSRASGSPLDVHRGFVCDYLAGQGYPHAVTCNVLERLELFRDSASGESADEAIVRIFGELRIALDPKELIAYAASPDIGSNQEKKQSSPRGKQQQRNGRSKHETKPDPDAFKAALAKHGFTGSLTPLTPAAQNYMETGSWYGADDDDDDEDSDESPPHSSDDDFGSDSELLPLVDFPPPRFPSAKPFESSTNARPAAPKQPAAKPPVAKPPAAKPPAKPPVGKRVAKPLQPQPVVTISDDDSEGMPSLVTSDESDNDDSCDRHSRRSPPPQPSKAPEARVTSKQAAKGKQVPSEIVSKGKQVPSEVVSKGKPAPSAAAAVGKQGSAAAPGTPIFKSVSRGYLAQQSSKLALHADATAAAASGSTGPSGSGSDRKEASSGFSFDRAVSGGSKGTVRKVQPSAQAQALLGKHADFFSHYELAADPNDEIPSLEDRLAKEEAEEATFEKASREQAAWREAEEQRRRAAMNRVGPGTSTSHYADVMETPQQRLAKQLAADAAMKQLLEEEENEKAEAAVKAEKAKKEKQKSKKAKQKAKKKAQQEAAAKRTGGKSAPGQPAARSKTPQADSSDSDTEDEEEQEVFSLQDSRFGSLAAYPTSAAGPGGSQQGGAGGSLDEEAGSSQQGGAGGSQQGGAGSSVNGTAVGSSAAESDNEAEEGQEDSLMMQYGGAFALLQNMGRAGPSSEKSHTSQDTQASSQAVAVPVLRPGESPLHWQQANPQVVEEYKATLQEMDDASAAGDRARLQDAIRGGVTWLSHNGSNPDWAANSAQVRSKVRDAKARLKVIMSKPAAAARPGASTSAAPSTAPVTQPPVSMPAGIPPGQMPPAFRVGQPPPPPPRVPANVPVLPISRNPSQQIPSAPVAEPRQAGRPYLQPYQPAASGATSGPALELYRPGPVQHGNRESYHQPYAQQGHAQEPYRQPYGPQGTSLEPYRSPYGYNGAPSGRGGPAGGGGTAYQVKPGGRGPYQQQGPGRGAPSGYQGAQQQHVPQEEQFTVYRQRQGPPRPPMQAPLSMPMQPQAAHNSQPGSAYGSEYGSVDRISLSGSELASPVKSALARNQARQKYVQPTPFEFPHQPSFDDSEDEDCVVCMDDIRSTRFVPCGHNVCCRACAEKVVQKSGMCPLCSTVLDGYNDVE